MAGSKLSEDDRIIVLGLLMDLREIEKHIIDAVLYSDALDNLRYADRAAQRLVGYIKAVKKEIEHNHGGAK